MPGEFTQPTGTLEIGDTKVISWGASSDAESNLSKYVLEAAIKGGGYTVIAQPTTPSYSYTIPTATSVKFRVKAVDSGGLESAYRDSVLFTVMKPTYYWSKYQVANQQYVNWAYQSTTTGGNGYSSYYTSGTSFYHSGSPVSYNYGSYPIGITFYGESNGSNSIDWYRYISATAAEKDIGSVLTREVMGSLVQSNITAI